MNWYHRLERRYVEYGSSLEATRAFGVFRALYDLVYNMNLAHLSPEVETLFERLDDAGARTACTPFLIYRGRHRHQVSLDGLLRRAVDATRLKFHHHTWGPARALLRRPLREPRGPLQVDLDPRHPRRLLGLLRRGAGRGGCLRLPALLAPRQRQLLAPPRPRGERRVDRQGGRLLRRAGRGGRRHGRASSTDHALILVADHAQTAVHRGLPLAELLGRGGRSCSPPTSGPSWRSSRSAPPAAPPTSTCCRARASGPSPTRSARRWPRSKGSTWSAGWSGPTASRCDAREPGVPAGERRRGGRARRAAAALPSRRRGRRPARRPLGPRRRARGAGRRRSRTGGCAARSTRTRSPGSWSALAAPHAGDFVVSLALGYEARRLGRRQPRRRRQPRLAARGDSLGPLLFVGCGPERRASEREQWTLRDVAPVVLEHFGL